MKLNNNFVTENLDDNIGSQYGRHHTVTTVAATDLTLTWPTTGETHLYIRFPEGASSYDVTVRFVSGDTGWTFTVPIGSDFVPFLTAQPKGSTTYILKTSIAQPAISLFYF
jgi:hypothetical protein